MECVARMNNIRSSATEIVNCDVIYNCSTKAAGRFTSLRHYPLHHRNRKVHNLML